MPALMEPSPEQATPKNRGWFELGVFALGCIALVKVGSCACGGPSLPSYDPRFERLARNVSGMAASTLGNGPQSSAGFSIDERQERLRTDDAFRKGDYVFDVGDGRREAVCDIRLGRARLQDGIFAIWEECFVPPSDRTWPVRFVRFNGADTLELGRIEITRRLCAGKTKIEVPQELRSIESFWTYGEPNPSQCAVERRRLSASRGLPCLIRVNPRAAELDVVPISVLLDFGGELYVEYLFRDEALDRFYLSFYVHPGFVDLRTRFRFPPLVLSVNAASFEAVLER